MKTIDQKVEFATHVRAEPERVYDALATDDGLDDGLPKDHRLTLDLAEKSNFVGKTTTFTGVPSSKG